MGFFNRFSKMQNKMSGTKEGTDQAVLDSNARLTEKEQVSKSRQAAAGVGLVAAVAAGGTLAAVNNMDHTPAGAPNAATSTIVPPSSRTPETTAPVAIDEAKVQNQGETDSSTRTGDEPALTTTETPTTTAPVAADFEGESQTIERDPATGDVTHTINPDGSATPYLPLPPADANAESGEVHTGAAIQGDPNIPTDVSLDSIRIQR